MRGFFGAIQGKKRQEICAMSHLAVISYAIIKKILTEKIKVAETLLVSAKDRSLSLHA